MALISFFDTETTGLLPKYFTLKDLDRLPHLVQLAAVLVDSDGWAELGSFDVLVKPEGFVIPDDATAIHGIKHDEAEKRGIPLVDAVSLFDDFLSRSAGMVAHNIDFDSKLIGISYIRTGRDPALIWNKPRKCTMKAATPICNLPGNFPGKPKWPKLRECYEHFFGEGFEGEHNALNDVRACIRVFQHLHSIKAI